MFEITVFFRIKEYLIPCGIIESLSCYKTADVDVDVSKKDG